MTKKNTRKVNRNKKPKQRDKNRWGFIAFFGILLTLLPLVYYRSGLDPAVNPRLLFLVVFLMLSSVFFLFNKKSYDTSVLREKLFYFPVAYFIITVLSALFALNPLEVNFDAGKTFTFVIMTAMSAVILSNTKNWHEKIPLFFIVPAIIFIAVGLSEYYEFVLFAKTKVSAQLMPLVYEVKGNMSHKNQYSIALMMLLPFLGFGIYKFHGWLRLLNIVLVALLMLLILILKTRSVWLGLGLASLVSIVILVFYGAKLGLDVKLRRIIGIAFFGLVAAFFITIYSIEIKDKESIVYKIKNISRPDDPNNIHRIKIWEITTKMIADNPLQGVGAGNWKINAPYYYSGYNFKKEQLNWLRPHNDYLWVFAEKGILGILVYLGIFIIAIYYLIKVFFNSPEKDKKILALFILAGLVGYLSVSFFSFPLERPHHQVYLAICLSLAVAMFHEQKSSSGNIKFFKPILMVVSLLLVYFIIYASSVLVMETRVREARILEQQGRYEQMLTLSKTIPSTFKNLDVEAMPIAWYRGLAYANLNQIEQANLAYQEAYLALPTRISLLNNLGRTYFQLKNYDEAKNCFLEALAILPEYFESLVNVSSTYIKLQDYEKANECLSKIKPKDMNEPLRNNLKFVQSKLKK